MSPIRRRLALAGLALLAASPALGQADAVPQTAHDAETGKLLAAGVQLMQSGKAADALGYFERVAADYDDKFSDPNMRYYSARTVPELLFYAVDGASTGKTKTVVIAANWSYAHYLKGYAMIELRRMSDAKPSLARAIALSPQNSQFLSELGHIYEFEKSWSQALDLYQQAETAAEFSPPGSKNGELARAWRGQGYVLVELKRWDEAEQRYRKCVELNQGDVRAQKELLFIQQQKAASRPR
jgi:tetratricopeptide (TPR) repeat protein